MLAKQNYHTTHIVVNNIVGAPSVNKTEKQHIETLRHTSEDVVKKKKVSLTLNWKFLLIMLLAIWKRMNILHP